MHRGMADASLTSAEAIMADAKVTTGGGPTNGGGKWLENHREMVVIWGFYGVYGILSDFMGDTLW